MPLERRIKDYIRAHGHITLADYMTRCLYDAQDGYYRSGDPLGAQGDFTTAPEVSQMFGELAGIWLADGWRNSGEPDAALLLELGPGRGTLMGDILRAARKFHGLYECLTLHLVEINATLRAKQREVLAEHSLPVHWHETLPELPPLPLFVIANEFFDALPIHQFRHTDNGWEERVVTLDNEGNLAWGYCHSERSEESQIAGDPSLALRMTTIETSPDSLTLVRRIAAHIVRHGGAALIIDYGYSEGSGDTFQSVARHRYHNPLETPGKADLTAHVDFAALAEVARQAGACAHGSITQSAWLKDMGIALRADLLCKKAPPARQEKIRMEMHRLAAPEEMGTLFRCLAITPPDAPPPAGFPSC